MKKRVFSILAVIAIIGFGLAACNSADGNLPANDFPDENDVNNQVDDTADDGETDLSTSGEVINISENLQTDPALIALEDKDSTFVCNKLHSGLILVVDGDLAPGLASDWQIADDELNYILTLSGSAVFSDGTPITTDEVVANFERWFDADNPLHGDSYYEAWQSYFYGFLGETMDNGIPLSFFDGIEKVNQRTFILHLNRPFPQLLEVLSLPQFSIVKPDSLLGSPSDIIGAGAYQIDTWDAEGLNLIPNPNYFGDVPQEELVFKFE